MIQGLRINVGTIGYRIIDNSYKLLKIFLANNYVSESSPNNIFPSVKSILVKIN